MNSNLTPDTQELLITIYDAVQTFSGGQTIANDWIAPITKEQRGNLSDLVKKDLLIISGPEADGVYWYELTDLGMDLASSLVTK